VQSARIADYPNLSNYVRDLYQVPGVAETVNMLHIKHHYYASHETINPTRIVPKGPVLDLTAPHDRNRFKEGGLRLTTPPTAPPPNTPPAAPRRRRRLLGQRVEREEAGLRDLAVRHLWPESSEVAHQIERDMVARAGCAVVVQRNQRGGPVRATLPSSAQVRAPAPLRRLALLHPAAGKLPARHIGVAHQQHGPPPRHGRSRARRASSAASAGTRVEQPVAEAGHRVVIDGASVRCLRSGGWHATCLAYKPVMFRLAHFSDIHLGPLPDVTYRDLASKRITGYINWHRSRRGSYHHSSSRRSSTTCAPGARPRRADRRSRQSGARQGDRGRPPLAGEAALRPDHVSVVPGNHDAYVPGALDKACRAWAPWMTATA
jgi:hypothetical protein